MITLVVLCSFARAQIQQFFNQFQSHRFQVALDLVAVIILLTVAVIVAFSATERWPRWAQLATLLVTGLATYLPVIVFGKVWPGMTGYFAGASLVLLSGWASWTFFVGAIGSLFFVPALWQFSAYEIANMAGSNVFLGIAIWGLARLALLTRDSDVRSGEIAQFAVIKERMRFARDLHDLLGYSLSAITLKAEFTRQLVIQNPSRARDELAEVLDIARQALADVRIAANGYRSISLAKETIPVSSLLTAAGIRANVEITGELLDESVDTVFATILREAVTNVLRHSRAQNCTIKVEIIDETVRLQVSNDGVVDSPAWGRHGSGLRNVSARLAAIGGRLSAEASDGWFSMLAVAPVVPPSAEREEPGAENERRTHA